MVSKVFQHFWFDRFSWNNILKVVVAWFFFVPKWEWNPQTWSHQHANTAIYQYKLHIIREVSSCSFHYAEINGPNQNIQWQFELPRSENRQKFLGWLTVLWSQMRQVFINIPTICTVSTWSTFPSLENLERLRDPPNRFWETGDTAQRIGFRRFTEWPLSTCAP